MSFSLPSNQGRASAEVQSLRIDVGLLVAPANCEDRTHFDFGEELIPQLLLALFVFLLITGAGALT